MIRKLFSRWFHFHDYVPIPNFSRYSQCTSCSKIAKKEHRRHEWGPWQLSHPSLGNDCHFQMRRCKICGKKDETSIGAPYYPLSRKIHLD